jgi:hypothetical protein
MSEDQSLRHTPVMHERDEAQPYQPEGDPEDRVDDGPEAERPIASGGNPDRKTERVPPVAPENATYESSFDEFAGTESVSTEDRR